MIESLGHMIISKLRGKYALLENRRKEGRTQYIWPFYIEVGPGSSHILIGD